MSGSCEFDKLIPLIDPMSVGGLLEIPLSKTFDTKGRADWLKGTLKKDLSLCCLFQKDRCFAGEKCHQVHVEQQFMDAVRAQQKNIISCCRRCHDTASLSSQGIIFFASAFSGVQQVKIDGATVQGKSALVDPARLAYTVGLVQLMQTTNPINGVLPIQAKSVCRLHLRRSCKYARDCKNIHVCPGLGLALSQGSSNPLVPHAEYEHFQRPAPKSSFRVSSGNTQNHKPQVHLPPKASLFDRVTESKTYQHAPPKAPQPIVFQAIPPVPLHPTFERPAAADVVLPMDRNEHSSCNELSIKLTGLCFDPQLLSQVADTSEQQRPYGLLDLDGECALSSATSSSRSYKFSLPF